MNNNITTDELLMLIGELVAEKFQLRKQLAQAINRIKELEAKDNEK